MTTFSVLHSTMTVLFVVLLLCGATVGIFFVMRLAVSSNKKTTPTSHLQRTGWQLKDSLLICGIIISIMLLPQLLVPDTETVAAVPSAIALLLFPLFFYGTGFLWIRHQVVVRRLKIKTALRLCSAKASKQILAGAVYGLALMPPSLLITKTTIYLLNYLHIYTEPQALQVWLSQPTISTQQIVAIGLLILIIAPVTEEVFFRGVILNGLLRKIHRKRALVLQALFFATIHNNLLALPALAFAGYCFGWVYLRRQSLVTAVAMHLTYNLMGVLQFFVSHH